MSKGKDSENHELYEKTVESLHNFGMKDITLEDVINFHKKKLSSEENRAKSISLATKAREKALAQRKHSAKQHLRKYPKRKILHGLDSDVYDEIMQELKTEKQLAKNLREKRKKKKHWTQILAEKNLKK